VTAVDDSFQTHDGTSIAFTLRSAPGALRLALVHSLALDRSVWDEVAVALEGDVELLTYDCRGHGRSDRRPGPYTAALFAADLAALFDHLAWPGAAVAGCSMGGNVAQAFAARYPERTTALGLIDTTAWYGEESAAKFMERAEAARTGGMGGLIGFQLTRWCSDEYRASHPEVLRRLSDVFVANSLDCYAASCELLGAADARGVLGSFRMPVAVVVGGDDYATPVSMAQALHSAIPQSTLTIIEGARHLTPVECPDRIASELRGLLARFSA
jgi:3-oxoadipate enol-lactonase